MWFSTTKEATRNMSSNPEWIVTMESGFASYALRRWDEKTNTYITFVSGGAGRMQHLCNALNELDELRKGVVELAEAAEEVAVEDEGKLPHTREFSARETVRQIKCVVQSWDDMTLGSKEAMRGIKHIMKEREE